MSTPNEQQMEDSWEQQFRDCLNVLMKEPVHVAYEAVEDAGRALGHFFGAMEGMWGSSAEAREAEEYVKQRVLRGLQDRFEREFSKAKPDGRTTGMDSKAFDDFLAKLKPTK